jgi:predicted nucleotidyltransferase
MPSNMKTFKELKDALAKQKGKLKDEFKVKEIGIFGSYVRGEQKKGSDVDILVEFEESANLSLIDFLRMENFLSDALGVKVDLVEKQTLKQRIGKHVLEEVVNV